MGEELLLAGVRGLAIRYLNIRPEGVKHGDRITALKQEIVNRGYDRLPEMDDVALKGLKRWLEEELGA